MITEKTLREDIEYLIAAQCGCCVYELCTKDRNTYAIVIGWADGFDPDTNDRLSSGDWHICGKVAYQPVNSIMQCDYDVDWLMPYNTGTNEVDDTDIAIYEDDIPAVIDWLVENAKRITA